MALLVVLGVASTLGDGTEAPNVDDQPEGEAEVVKAESEPEVEAAAPVVNQTVAEDGDDDKDDLNAKAEDDDDDKDVKVEAEDDDDDDGDVKAEAEDDDDDKESTDDPDSGASSIAASISTLLTLLTHFLAF